MNDSQVPFTENPENIQFASSLIDPIREPVLVLNGDAIVVAANAGFSTVFDLTAKDLQGQPILEMRNGLWDVPGFRDLLSELSESDVPIRDREVNLKTARYQPVSVAINSNRLQFDGGNTPLYLLTFEVIKRKTADIPYRKLLNEVLSEAPAAICILRGREHFFELANDNYMELLGYRDIIGKRVIEAVPEAESQGFLELLDQVFNSGEPYVGKEVEITFHGKNSNRKSFLDFVYQPIKDAGGNVEGIFVHGIDVTEKVVNRRILESNEKELRNLIDTVPVIVWITDEQGNGSYLNQNWYNYTGQDREKSMGKGWLQVIHPDDYASTEEKFIKAHREQSEFDVSYRLKNKAGNYRWVIDRGRPKFNAQGEFQGLIGSVTDVHEEKLQEQVIKEKEHRTRSIVEEATIATGVYTGREMTIELANDAMLEVWGKDRSVVGKTLRTALPELEGQPFHDLLQKVFTTGETYWGKEDRVDLMRNGKMETGFFNFTYKPLRNKKGEIYGILNMALDVTEMVEARNLLKEREKHFRLMADLMPEKVMATNAAGEAIYFNQNWLEYADMSREDLEKGQWTELIHPDDKEKFWEKGEKARDIGVEFEMEMRLRNRSGKYIWHLTRAEAVRDEQGEIKMWIGTNTEIQRLKEEEKRKGDFLKMVSHELKTPVTSIKGYVQLLLNIVGEDKKKPASIPLKPSLERINNQVIRLTRLISEMLDLSRLEENKLELKKEVFSINDLVDQTVQDIQLTNTQHQMQVFHTARAKVLADRDRIGQVLINLITNAIKYSPESQHIEIHVLQVDRGNVAVSVRDKGIGIDRKYQKNIFKRFYRIGGISEDTYSGFGIGLYLANEIIQRHNGTIEVKSKKGRGSDFSFVLSAVSEEN